VTRSDRPSRCTRGRGGFTLIELLVALLVGAMVVLGARLMLEGVADDARRIHRFAQRSDHDANAERALRSTVESLDVGTVGVQPFEGDEHTVRFTAWCARPGGWQERCAVTVSIAGDSSTASLVLTLPGDKPLNVRSGARHGELCYLADAHYGGRWVRHWGAGLSVPLAIGAILDADTLVLRIGERG
jgi:prepilin-type N-terminal cleavage/methylation domain-containing protein